MIKDEEGLMSTEEFRTTFHTFFKNNSEVCKATVIEMLLPLIEHD